MKKLNTSLAIAVALAAGVGTSAWAQNVKQDTISFSLTVLQQLSVSTSASVANAGNWSQGPLHYKTTSMKMTQANILKSIAIVMHGNPNFYTSQAKLELVQGELGGFWNINDAVAQSFADFSSLDALTGSFNDDGSDTSVTEGPIGPLGAVFFPDNDGQYGIDPADILDFAGNGDNPATSNGNTIPDILDDGLDGSTGRISLSDGPGSSLSAGGGAYARLDTGRHFLPVPWQNYSTVTEYATTGEYPPGHMQPWGQVYVKDAGHGTTTDPLCENVTFFFDFQVQECYDCFYLSSFISDANFSIKPGSQVGPPCCSTSGVLLGTGTDRYYLEINFDNTFENPFLNPSLETNEGDVVSYFYPYVGFTGLVPSIGTADGLTPDLLPYVDSIKSGLGTPSPYELRFTLNGIVTYSWKLELLNPNSDVAADYVGNASYAANGFGFIGLVCSLITGSATFSEAVVKDVGCCDDVNWYEDTFNSGFNDTYATGWFGPGYDGNEGYFNPNETEFDAYPYYNIVGGEVYPDYTTVGAPTYNQDLPEQWESPLNPYAAIAFHGIFDSFFNVDL